MHQWLVWIACGAASYLLGAVPTGLLVGLAKGIDIRTVGSGNIGATNVFRALGKWWGGFTLVADALKGFVPARIFPLAAAHFAGVGESTGMGLMCAALAVAGHTWPVYLRFRGGKGVATSAGAGLGLAPTAILVGAAAWGVVFAASRYVSLASLTAVGVICAYVWIVCRAQGIAIPIVFSLIGLLVIWRHRTNVRRLLKGTENKIGSGRGQKGERAG